MSFRRATLAVRRGNPDEAIALARESLTLFRQLHDKFAIVYAMVPLAAAAVLKGDDLWAARILGARDAVTERTGATVVDKWVHALGGRREREVSARLGPDRWGRAYAAGPCGPRSIVIKDIDTVSKPRRCLERRQLGLTPVGLGMRCPARIEFLANATMNRTPSSRSRHHRPGVCHRDSAIHEHDDERADVAELLEDGRDHQRPESRRVRSDHQKRDLPRHRDRRNP